MNVLPAIDDDKEKDKYKCGMFGYGGAHLTVIDLWASFLVLQLMKLMQFMKFIQLMKFQNTTNAKILQMQAAMAATYAHERLLIANHLGRIIHTKLHREWSHLVRANNSRETVLSQ